MPGICELPGDTILLFEERQLMSWPEYGRRQEFVAAFRAYPHIEWFARHEATGLKSWIDDLMSEYGGQALSKDELLEAIPFPKISATW